MRYFEINHPDDEKVFSDVTDVAGIPKYIFASLEMVGNLLALIFHHSKGSFSITLLLKMIFSHEQ